MHQIYTPWIWSIGEEIPPAIPHRNNFPQCTEDGWAPLVSVITRSSGVDAELAAQLSERGQFTRARLYQQNVLRTHHRVPLERYQRLRPVAELHRKQLQFNSNNRYMVIKLRNLTNYHAPLIKF